MDKRKIGVATMMAVMYGMASSSSNLPKERQFVTAKTPTKKVIPKGCAEYHFTKCGTQVSSTCTYIYFSCIASSSKVAIDKFNKFCLKNPPL